MAFEYVREYYQVPAEFGRLVKVNGRSGIIIQDRGHYIGVNFDDDKPGVVSNVHPTWEVEYLGLGEIRQLTKPQQRYRRYMEYGDCFETFIDFCRWDSDPEREWNL